MVGFGDGVVRHITLLKTDDNVNRNKRSMSPITMKLAQVFKPHLKDVSCMAIDGQGKVLATGVSNRFALS